jgi:ATP-dependent protease HslVU (ClpYQ) peptidase subunit
MFIAARSSGFRLATSSLFGVAKQGNFAAKIVPSGNVLKQTCRSTTILCVRKDGQVVMAGDGQVSQGPTVCKGNAKKVRRLKDNILVGFAGSTADALTLLERLEKKLEEHPGQLMRACVELAKSWRSDKYLRNLEVTIAASYSASANYFDSFS